MEAATEWAAKLAETEVPAAARQRLVPQLLCSKNPADSNAVMQVARSQHIHQQKCCENCGSTREATETEVCWLPLFVCYASITLDSFPFTQDLVQTSWARTSVSAVFSLQDNRRNKDHPLCFFVATFLSEPI